ncbi:type I restriction endonuclease subunit S [Xanthomonas oryzae pv. oryzae]|nr:restriction endonuclease subunit S [Xanthomonas oryzae]UMA62838.1 type I restriction endonuclease subunit S [Xanthomonas oryzae pv. oryzae]
MVSELPGGWGLCRLGEILELKYGKALPARSRDGGAYPVYGSNGIVGNHSAYLAEGPTVIVGRKGSVGEVCYSAVPCFPIDTTYYAEEFEVTHSNFIYYLLRNLDLASLNKSTAIPGLNRQDAYDLEIPLPPLAEQKRIAQKLDALLAQVDTLKARIDAIPALLKRFRQSVINHGVSGSLALDQHASFDTTTWRNMRAEDVCTKVQSGGTPKEGFTTEGIPFLKVYNIVDGIIEFEYRPQYIAADIHQGSCRKSITIPGDVLMNIVGPPLGKIAVVPQGVDEWNINQAITLFRPSESISSAWIHLVLLEGTNIRRVSQETKGSAGQVNISLSQCRDFVFPVPPTQIQDEIVRRVEQLFAYADQLEAKVAAAQQRIDALTQSLLAKAFRGELVPQDPGDEPASVLLERIRAQRAAAPKPKRGRKAATS